MTKGRKKWLIAGLAAAVAVLEVVGPAPLARALQVLGAAVVQATAAPLGHQPGALPDQLVARSLRL